MPYATNAGTRIWWEEHGNPDGEAVLLIMGHAYGAAMWHRTIPTLAPRFRVLAFDNRGVGRSNTPRGAYTVETMAADAVAVLDAAGVERAHVYGVSMGGMTAQELALSHGERVRSLVLGCTGCSPARISRGPALGPLRYIVPVSVLHRIGKSFLYDRQTPAARIAEDHAIIGRTKASPRGIAGQLRGTAAYDSCSRLGDIAVPTLVIHGEGDRIVPVAEGRYLAERIPGAQLVVLPDAGHVFPTDATEESNRVVVDFLAAAPDRA